ncbi:MAG: hypothetical protein JSV64_04730 [Candidatus Bathyarchaeota archaeon]|nr:MAG: hypothetical protein JSV64_04730 [Candidatus Bathyarchaeota archaeon]
MVLKFPEWLRIVKNFGVEYTAPSISCFFLRRKANGSCVFLLKTPRDSYCSLQDLKPQACKMWPFKILDKPKYGKAKHAAYDSWKQRLYIYLDQACTGIRYGIPTKDFSHSVLPEFVELALGVRRKQHRSTSMLHPPILGGNL